MSFTLLSDSLMASSISFEAAATISLVIKTQTFDSSRVACETSQRNGGFVDNSIRVGFKQVEYHTEVFRLSSVASPVRIPCLQGSRGCLSGSTQ